MVREATIAALLVTNMAMLIATSPLHEEEDRTGSFPVVLAPGSPVVHVTGRATADPSFEELKLSIGFEGVNQAPSGGQISLYALPLDAKAVPEGAEPIDTEDIAAAGEGERLVFSISQELDRDSLGPFHLALVLDGEARLDGAVVVRASGATYQPAWVKLSEVQVDAGQPPP